MAPRLLGALARALALLLGLLLALLGAPGCATNKLQEALLDGVGHDPTRALRPLAAEVEERADGTVALRITMRLDDGDGDGVDPGTAWDYVVTIPRTGTAQVADAGEHAGVVYDEMGGPPRLLPTPTAAPRAKAPPWTRAPRLVVTLAGAAPCVPVIQPVSVLAKGGVGRMHLDPARLSRAVVVMQAIVPGEPDPSLPEEARPRADAVPADAEETDYLLEVYLPPPSGHRIEARPDYEGGPVSDRLLIGAPRAVVRLPHADRPGRRAKARAGDAGSIALFALCVPATIAFDIVTAPVQIVLFYIWASSGGSGRWC